MTECIECGSQIWREPFCKRCYSKMAMRKWRTGTTILKPPTSLVERFLSHVKKTESCWLWTGTIDKDYGRFAVTANKGVRAHRWAYEHWIGPIPEGKQIDHICRIRNCVRPEHLRIVTAKENGAWKGARITHCPQGHPYDEANTTFSGGRRHCKACARERSNRYQRNLFNRTRDVIANPDKTTCPQGHAYPPFVKGGHRSCRICQNAATARYRARQKAKQR